MLELKEIDYIGSYDYDDLVTSFGYKILDKLDEGSYQGTFIYLLQRPDMSPSMYGLLLVGYGSCSGCDSLQACATYKEVVELRDSLYDDIKWGSQWEDFIKEMELGYFGEDSNEYIHTKRMFEKHAGVI